MSVEKMAELRKLSDEELINKYDALAGKTQPGTAFYLDELARRQQNRLARQLLVYTKWMTTLTIVVAACTVVVTLATLFG